MYIGLGGILVIILILWLLGVIQGAAGELLAQLSCPTDLRGETSLELRPVGLHFSIELPLPAKRT